jgi:hypothetical protein
MPEIEGAGNGRLSFKSPESSALLRPASVQGPVLTEYVRPELPAGQVRNQVPLSTGALPGSAASGKPRWYETSRLLAAAGVTVQEVEEVGCARLRELHQRAVRTYERVMPRDRPEQHAANLGGDQRHCKIPHQALVLYRQPGHRLVLPAATGRRSARSGQEL